MNGSRVTPIAKAALALLIGGTVLVLNDGGSGTPGALTSQAEARVGRPATPMSYAGVARRTTRRAVYGTAAGAAAAGAYYYNYAPGCRQVVNSYGQIVYACP